MSTYGLFGRRALKAKQTITAPADGAEADDFGDFGDVGPGEMVPPMPNESGAPLPPGFTLDEPPAPSGETINAEGTNHREVWADKFDVTRPDPNREAPPGSALAGKRARSRALSPVPSQTTYKRQQYHSNSTLDGLMDRGIAWHYSKEAQAIDRNAKTVRRSLGAIAWYDECGLRWRDRMGQNKPRYNSDCEENAWDPAGYGKPVREYTGSEQDRYRSWRDQPRTGGPVPTGWTPPEPDGIELNDAIPFDGDYVIDTGTREGGIGPVDGVDPITGTVTLADYDSVVDFAPDPAIYGGTGPSRLVAGEAVASVPVWAWIAGGLALAVALSSGKGRS